MLLNLKIVEIFTLLKYWPLLIIMKSSCGMHWVWGQWEEGKKQVTSQTTQGKCRVNRAEWLIKLHLKEAHKVHTCTVGGSSSHTVETVQLRQDWSFLIFPNRVCLDVCQLDKWMVTLWQSQNQKNLSSSERRWLCVSDRTVCVYIWRNGGNYPCAHCSGPFSHCWDKTSRT